MDVLQPTRTRIKLTTLCFLFFITLGIILLYWPYFIWLWSSWNNNPQDTFGYLAPIISFCLFYRNRNKIFNVNPSYAASGWYHFISGIFLTILFQWNRQMLAASIGLPVLIYGFSIIFWGKERSRHLIFPIFFLMFLYPWGDVLDFFIGYDLRRLNVLMSYYFFNLIGLEAAVSGTYLYTGRFLVDIAPACSGLKIFNVLLFMGVIGVYIYRGSIRNKIILVVSIIPIAVLSNTIRIICVGLLGHFKGQETAISFYDNLSGILVFGVAMLILYFEGVLLKTFDNKYKGAE